MHVGLYLGDNQLVHSSAWVWRGTFNKADATAGLRYYRRTPDKIRRITKESAKICICAPTPSISTTNKRDIILRGLVSRGTRPYIYTRYFAVRGLNQLRWKTVASTSKPRKKEMPVAIFALRSYS